MTAPASLTMTAYVSMAASVQTGPIFTDVRCTARKKGTTTGICDAWLMAVPGQMAYQIRLLTCNDARTGHGIAVRCRNCGWRMEISFKLAGR